ncbi:Uncharacterized membrane protein YheB, UPF0754 family [Gracilibacillus ureilyticus]|uniref:Uncharacterized membrane protein YheB, UPF0754 family n=1 Tax=Gracilibacillus ureilyticus TaxID=531814 RepID=A0A1H9SJ37_9BACI|nr:DUF445 family protein [Gracilibacillus ureilyticus]SER84967.1 Uncharacterized membrane protein YheB, UPF0754 family [Gracilibacillus ureilyticus]
MNIFITLLSMILIGGLIGGLTNSLAIKMLFRPYEAKFIGKWRVPFTPGVIPKRRDQLAIQLGQLVVNHLVTAESLQNKLKEKGVKQQVIQLLNREFYHFLEKQFTIEQLAQQLGLPINKEVMEQKIGDFVISKYDEFIRNHSNISIGELLTADAEDEINIQLEKLSSYIHEQIIDLIGQPETKRKIERIISEYAQTKGFFGNMLMSMFSGDELSGKIQELVINYLRTDDGYMLLKNVIYNEWHHIKSKKLVDFQHVLEKRSVKNMVRNFIVKNIQVSDWLGMPVQTFIAPVKSNMETHIIPKLVDLLLDRLTEKVPLMLAKLEVEKMVEKQVASFPTARIEDIILSISRKEFKLITYLGALLGGMIGLIQGILFVLVG